MTIKFVAKSNNGQILQESLQLASPQSDMWALTCLLQPIHRFLAYSAPFHTFETIRESAATAAAKSLQSCPVEIKSANGIYLYQDKEKTKAAKKLSLSNMDVGLKPATGEIDSETKVPSTITDEGTSEGYYSTIYIETDLDFKVIVKDIIIESKNDELKVKEERENIFVAIKDVKNSAKSLEKDVVELAEFSNTSQLEKLTFFIWLSSFASGELEGAKISFILEFVLR